MLPSDFSSPSPALQHPSRNWKKNILMKSYEEKIDWLFNQFPSYQKVGKVAYKPGIETMTAFDEALGHLRQRAGDLGVDVQITVELHDNILLGFMIR